MDYIKMLKPFTAQFGVAPTGEMLERGAYGNMDVDYTKMLKPFILNGVTPTSEMIGRGAYGSVFKVKYSADCAAKEVHSILVDSMPQQEVKNIKDQFLRMSYLLSRCHHPNIVQFIGIYYSKSDMAIPTIVTELMDCSLSKFIEQNTMPLHSVVSILHDVSLGVWYLHSRSPPIMHCDLTPNNILVNKTLMVAKVAGFGVALEGTKGYMKVPGTVHFMPPEALVDEPCYGLPIDVFSYGGVALYTVVREWPGPSNLRREATEVERRLQYLDKMVGSAAVFRPLVEECLNNDPARRPTIEVVAKRIKDMKIYKDYHPETKLGELHLQQVESNVWEQKDQQLQQLLQRLQEKDQELQHQDQQLRQQNQWLRQKDLQLQQKDQQLQQKDQNIQQLQENRHGDKSTWVVNRREIRVSEKLLGTGGWGSVREGTFRGCRVAVKCIDNEIISPYNLRLFSREMDMAARCRHPNLMQFIAATDEGVPLIVTELMHTSLRKILQQSQLHSNQIIPILLGASCGLNYLHKTTPIPILHRDISSANVLLNPLPNNQWHAKLSDFGSANFMRASNTVGAGNPSYAAPEALKPAGPHTPAMDVFSFGVLMYEMCSREFPADKPNPSMLNNVKWDVIESRLVGMIRSCLSHDIQGRPSMDDLIYGLNR